ncbi:MAG: hypothetical protein VW877_15085 [Pseudomonadaceae bacterium]
MHRHWLAVIAALLSGCVVSPESATDSVGAPLPGLQVLAGCYQNRGEPSDSVPKRYLSQLFWPALTLDEHVGVEQLEVEPLSATAVRIRALQSGAVIRQSDFREGEHFTRRDDRIELSSNWGSSLAAPADNPFIGAYHERVSLWLDTQGDGRMTNTATFAGTAFLIIPLAGTVSEQRRFERLGDHCPRN